MFLGKDAGAFASCVNNFAFGRESSVEIVITWISADIFMEIDKKAIFSPLGEKTSLKSIGKPDDFLRAAYIFFTTLW